MKELQTVIDELLLGLKDITQAAIYLQQQKDIF